MRIIILLYALLASGILHAQVNRYWVAFKDKPNGMAALESPASFLSPDGLSRRSHNAVELTIEDAPVEQSYLNQLNDWGKLLYPLKWFNGAVVEIEVAHIPDVEALDFVEQVDLVAPGVRPPAIPMNNGAGSAPVSQTDNDEQLELLGLDAMHADGFLGEGVKVAVLDGGFTGVNTNRAFTALWENELIKMAVDLNSLTPMSFNDHIHGAAVLSIMAATIGNYKGGSPKATFYLFNTEYGPTEYNIEEYNWTRAVEMADSAGVQVINSSLGYTTFDDPSMNYSYSDLDGNTSVITRAAKRAHEKGMVVVVSAGNKVDAWARIDFPADADSILAVGSINHSDEHSFFSLLGPSQDGRVKPDVVAYGNGVPYVVADGDIEHGSGTSFSSPMVASLATCLIEAYPELTASELVNHMKTTATNADNPDNMIGYGVPSYQAIKKLLPSPLEPTAQVDVYPNPASEILHVRWGFPNERVAVTLSNIVGSTSYLGKISVPAQGIDFEMDISGFSKGVYLLHLTSDERTIVRKILIW